MSHITKCSTHIEDLNALESAATELGFEVLRNATCKLYYNSQHYTSELVIRHPKMRFDIGVKKQEDGTYELVTDHHAGSVRKIAGFNTNRKLGKIIDMYSVHVLEKRAAKRRLKTKRIKKLTGKTTVRVFTGG